MERLVVMARKHYGQKNVTLSGREDCVDEFTSLQITSNNLTSLYHWFEFALVHLPKKMIADQYQLNQFHSDVLKNLNNDIHIVDYLWNFKQ